MQRPGDKAHEVKELPSALFGDSDEDGSSLFFSSPSPPPFSTSSFPFSSFSPAPTSFEPNPPSFQPPVQDSNPASFFDTFATQPQSGRSFFDSFSSPAPSDTSTSYFDTLSTPTPDSGASFFDSFSSQNSDLSSPPTLFPPSSETFFPPSSSPQFLSNQINPQDPDQTHPPFPPTTGSVSEFFSVGSSPPRVKSSPNFLSLASESSTNHHLESSSTSAVPTFSPEGIWPRDQSQNSQPRSGIQHSRSRSYSGTKTDVLRASTDRNHGFGAFAFGRLILVSNSGKVRVTTLKHLYTRAKEQESGLQSASSFPDSLSPFSLSSSTLEHKSLNGFSYFQSLLKFPGPLTKSCKLSEKSSVSNWSSWSSTLTSSLSSPSLASLASPASSSSSSSATSGQEQLRKYFDEHIEWLHKLSSSSSSNVHSDAILCLYSLLRERINSPLKSDEDITLWLFQDQINALQVKESQKLPSGPILRAKAQSLHQVELSEHDNARDANDHHHSETSSSDNDLESRMEALQIRLAKHGITKEVVEFAVEQELWSDALILASSISDVTMPSLQTDPHSVTQISSASPGNEGRTQSRTGPTGGGHIFQWVVSQYCQKVLNPTSLLSSLYSTFNGDWNCIPVEEWKRQVVRLLNGPDGSQLMSTQQRKKALGSLADSLWFHHDCLPAAHFCYLVASCPFGFLDNPNSRLVLLGGDHKRRGRAYISPETIQLTEIYEYCKYLTSHFSNNENNTTSPSSSLSKSKWVLASFQVYKFLYAQMLADFGLMEKAWDYYEEVSNILDLNNPTTPSPNVANKLTLPQKATGGESHEDSILFRQNSAFLIQFQTFGDRLSKNTTNKNKWKLPQLNQIVSKVVPGLENLLQTVLWGDLFPTQAPAQAQVTSPTRSPIPATPLHVVHNSTSPRSTFNHTLAPLHTRQPQSQPQPQLQPQPQPQHQSQLQPQPHLQPHHPQGSQRPGLSQPHQPQIINPFFTSPSQGSSMPATSTSLPASLAASPSPSLVDQQRQKSHTESTQHQNSFSPFSPSSEQSPASSAFDSFYSDSQWAPLQPPIDEPSNQSQSQSQPQPQFQTQTQPQTQNQHIKSNQNTKDDDQEEDEDGNGENDSEAEEEDDDSKKASNNNNSNNTNSSGILSKVWGWFNGPAKTGGPKKVHLGEENKFVYDKDLKRWVIQGQELPEDESPAAPPPAAFIAPASPASFTSPSSPYAQTYLDPASPSPSSGASPSFVPPSTTGTSIKGGRSRYVDIFNNPSPGSQPTPSTPAPSFTSNSIPQNRSMINASSSLSSPYSDYKILTPVNIISPAIMNAPNIDATTNYDNNHPNETETNNNDVSTFFSYDEFTPLPDQLPEIEGRNSKNPKSKGKKK